MEQNRAETSEECLERELREELFYRHELPEGLFVQNAGHLNSRLRENNPEHKRIYTGTSSGPFYPNTHEISEVRFEDFLGVIQDIKANPDKYTDNLGECLEFLNNLFR